jgi:1,4-alpha-glucan branching enzyme
MITRQEAIMNSTLDEPNGTTELITFHCTAAEAGSVSLIGDFNNWNAKSHPMRPGRDGSWMLDVLLSRGRHYYQFLVDGQPVLDPEAMYAVSEILHSKVSLIALS